MPWRPPLPRPARDRRRKNQCRDVERRRKRLQSDAGDQRSAPLYTAQSGAARGYSEFEVVAPVPRGGGGEHGFVWWRGYAPPRGGRATSPHEKAPASPPPADQS